jgi:acetaldehyde dehydrogenase / alcohol dehydrogenase
MKEEAMTTSTQLTGRATTTFAAGKWQQDKPALSESIADARDPEIDALVARSVTAQQVFAIWPEERVDALLRDLAATIADHAEQLAAATVAETGIGNIADKTQKNCFASMEVYRSLAGKPGAGVVHVDDARQVAEVASPVGVVLGLIPMTNPVATLIFKTLICLKGRNALILSCHPRTLGVTEQTGQLIQATLRRHGAPPALVQWIRRWTGHAMTHTFMRHPGVALILATGGSAMVKAAYSSGKPAIGVGTGNAPAWVCADADVESAARMVVESKSFDHGVICGSEHHMVVDAAVRARFIAALEGQGAAVLSEDAARRFTAQAFDSTTGKLRNDLIGQSAERIALELGIQVVPGTRLLVVPAGVNAIDGPYGREKLAPVLSLFTVVGVEAGLDACKRLLANEGRGHTAIIHTGSDALARRFGIEIDASRILVNTCGAQGCIGIGTGLAPSLMLGCGTFGGTSTTDNVGYKHVLNIKRIAYGIGAA